MMCQRFRYWTGWQSEKTVTGMQKDTQHQKLAHRWAAKMLSYGTAWRWEEMELHSEGWVDCRQVRQETRCSQCGEPLPWQITDTKHGKGGGTLTLTLCSLMFNLHVYGDHFWQISVCFNWNSWVSQDNKRASFPFVRHGGSCDKIP